jgi:hypothetical protein
VKTAKLFALGMIIMIAAAFAVTGCSDNSTSPVAPESDITIIEKTPPRDAQSTEFTLSGQMVELDIEKPMVVLAAKTVSDRSDEVTKYYLEVSRDAKIVLLRDRTEVPFDSRYLTSGMDMTVSGRVLDDGARIAERFELWQEDPNTATTTIR